jgi:hypothetical protein
MKKLLFVAGAIAMLSSCTVFRDYQLTGKPLGTKTGVAKTKVFGKQDYSIDTASKNGDISVIGAVEIKTKMYLIFPITTTTVYGE